MGQNKTFTSEEKVLILSALFHDIGKFEQRCTNYNSIAHPLLSSSFLEKRKDKLVEILENEESFKLLLNLVENHHTQNNSELLTILKNADHLSASERVEAEKNDVGKIQWGNKFLASIFSKIKLVSEREVQTKYFSHQELTGENYNVIIPDLNYNQQDREYTYPRVTFENFSKDIDAVINIYNKPDEFDTLINLLLKIFEKYLWCIPDFTGSTETDISLYNHLKDVAAISYAIYNSEDKNLNLIIGDLPGIQKYIFDVVYKKPAKMLRGRSIYVQVLTRIFASIFLEQFNLTEAGLIMLAGGKFYILAPSNKKFEANYKAAIYKIENYLKENFDYSLSFSAGYTSFNYEELKNKEITFGEIVEEASHDLLNGRRQQFKSFLFNNTGGENFVLESNYIEDNIDSNNIKCKITGKPIKKGHDVPIETEEGTVIVDRQIRNEYRVGKNIVKNNLVIEFAKGTYNVNKVYKFKNNDEFIDNKKILINPKLSDLLEGKNTISLLRNTTFLDVANYVSFNGTDNKAVMNFDDMAKKNVGAELLTLIKGDIDNLGLTMSLGLTGNYENAKLNNDNNDLTSISRTTTLSNALKYFFSFYLNGFLTEWCQKGKDHVVYTVFAGGDDLFLVTTQSASLDLVKELNNKFKEFVCNNSEVHISYSITHFKDDTPIRIVADMAEENQELSKKGFVHDLPDNFHGSNSNYFEEENNKAGLYLFDTAIKNKGIKKIIIESNKLYDWVNSAENPLTTGIVRDLLEISEMIKDFDKYKITAKLMWHPLLTYRIRRSLENKYDKYPEVKNFFDAVLSIKLSKIELKDILYPLLCNLIYRLRNNKE